MRSVITASPKSAPLLAALLQLSLLTPPCLAKPAGRRDGDSPTEPAGDPALSQPPIGLERDAADSGLVPWPMRGEIFREWAPLGPEARIVFSSEELQPLARILAEKMLLLTGRSLPVAAGPPRAGDICLRIDPKLSFSADPYLKLDPALRGLEQRIVASAKGVLVDGTCYQATAMAAMTLLQSFAGTGAELRYPLMKIEDKPGSRYCGVMVDVARQWHPIGHLRGLVDLCELYKVPFLHLHFSDDQGFRLPSRSYPAIPTLNASYTEAEIRELVAYADARGVAIVPEIELPGHSAAMQAALPGIFGAKNPVTGASETLGVINIANEAIYPVLETIIAETCELFRSSPYFHIGADETQFSAFFAHPAVRTQLKELDARGISEDQVFAHFLNRMNAIVRKQGKRTICWEGFGPEAKVDRDIVIMAWHGSSHSPQDLLKAGYEIINVPWTPSIYSSARENYEWNKWSLNLSEAPAHSRQFGMDPHIIGGQMVLWEKGPDEMIRLLRSKLPARQERLYSPATGRPFADFSRRYAHTDGMFERLAYPVAVALEGTLNREENLFHDRPVKVTLSCPVADAKIFYSIGGEDPTPDTGTLYQGSFLIDATQARQVFISGYYGPRAELRVRAYSPDERPLGSSKWLELRCEAPRIAYTVYETPPGTVLKAMPAIEGLRSIASGRLARFESTRQLAREASGPLVLQAAGRIDIRTAGDYEITLTASNSDNAANTRVRIGDRWIGPFTEGAATVKLAVGIQPISIEQFANDGGLGAVLTFRKYLEDSGPEPRRFTNEYLHQWMLPLEQ